VSKAGEPPEPLLRWADGLRVRVVGGDGVIEDPDAGPLRLPGAGAGLLALGRLLTTPRPASWLRARLAAEDHRDPRGDLVGRLQAARVLVAWDLGQRLARAHMDTTAPSSWPAPAAAEETARLLRDYAGPGVDLPRPVLPAVTLAEALAGRRSGSAFPRARLRPGTLGTILGLAAGISANQSPGPLATGGPPGPRPYPSGGGLYPVEIMVAASRCEGVPRGFHRYAALAHRLVTCAPLPPTGELTHLLNEHPVADAAAFVLLWSDLARPSFGKYGVKAYRLMMLEAGHVAQNLLLTAAALGLPTLPLCGFLDAALAAAAGLAFPYEVVLYVVAVGGDEPDGA